VPPLSVPVALSVVNAPVVAVVAPTVPLMLMLAVPVRLVTVPLDGVPNAGVTRVGLVANTRAPEPVSSVIALAKLALDGVPNNVATPVPKEVMPVPPLATGKVPVTPVDRGNPVPLVNTTAEGVPRLGVVKTGLVDNTTLPVPVEVVTPVPPLATGNVPVTPVVNGKPVALVRVPDAGVPRTGAVKVGLVRVLLVKVSVVALPTNVSVEVGRVMVLPVLLIELMTGVVRVLLVNVCDLERVTISTPSTVITPAAERAIVVSVACPSSILPTPIADVVEAVIPLTGNPVALVNVTADGVPRLGVVNIGLIENTRLPEPVSSVTTVAKLAAVGVAKNVATPLPKPLIPVLIGRPVALVNTA